MRIDPEALARAPEDVRRGSEPRIGEVYAVAGGRGGPRVRVVVAISGNTAYSLIFSTETGEVTGVDQSSVSYLSQREYLGRATFPNLDVEWADPRR